MKTIQLSLMVVWLGCLSQCSSPPGEICGTSNCSGCCDPSGQCLSGIIDTHCGKGGLACNACTSPQVCQAQVCGLASGSGGGQGNTGGGQGNTGGGQGNTGGGQGNTGGGQGNTGGGQGNTGGGQGNTGGGQGNTGGGQSGGGAGGSGGGNACSCDVSTVCTSSCSCDPDCGHTVDCFSSMEDSSNVGTTQTLYGVSLTSTGGWAVGPQQTLLHYQGTTWTSVNAPDGTDTYSLRDVRLIDDQNGWAVGDWTTFAGGSSYTYGMALKLSAGIWTIKQSSLAWQLQGLDLVDKDNGWAVGSKGQVAKFLNGQYSPVYEGAVLPQLNAVDVIDMNTGWAVGSGGFIRKLENGTWTAPAKPTSKTLNSIVLVDAQNGWAVGDEGTIVQLANGTWSVITPITNRGLNSIIHASDGTFWVVGDFGTVLRYTNNQWEQCSYGGIANPSLNSVAEQGGTIWAVGNNAHRLRLK